MIGDNLCFSSKFSGTLVGVIYTDLITGKRKMELIPIIKLALLVFTIAATVIIIGSYIAYKVKSKMSEPKPQLVKVPTSVSYRNLARITHHSIPKQVSSPMLREQEFFIPQRNSQTGIKSKRYQKERFKIINNQQDEMRKFESGNNPERAFYQPAVQDYSLFNSKPKNLLDRYASENERLNKLNFITR